MNFLNIFEDRVAGIFGASRAPFSFKKLAKQAAREMEAETLVVNGVDTAPALYTVLISKNDDALLAQYYPQLTGELSELVKAQATKRKYTFVGEPLVRFMVDPALKPGKFSVFAENVDAPTLARLYEEERSYLSGGQPSAGRAGNRTPAPQPAAGSRDPFAPLAGRDVAAGAPDPFAPSMPATVSRDAFAGNGAAAIPQPPAQAPASPQAAAFGAGAAAGAAAGGIAANMVNSRAGAAAPQQQRQAAPAPARPMAELADVVSGQVIPITSARCIIGRERASADVILRDPNVSRRHAELAFTGSGWTIEDLNSTNGTSVNNRRVTRCPLRSGDMVTFGLTTFEFRG